MSRIFQFEKEKRKRNPYDKFYKAPNRRKKGKKKKREQERKD